VKIFLSWSKERSLGVATALKGWLPLVIQSAKPWLSDDIEKGSRWSTEIAAALEASNVGIFCLTPENLEEPWLLFEAGAVAKSSQARAMTFLLGLDKSDVRPPLSMFQHTAALDEADVLKMVQTLNTKRSPGDGDPLADGVLRETFDAHWPKLRRQLKAIAVKHKVDVVHTRPQEEILAEILEIARGIAQRVAVVQIEPFIAVAARQAVAMELATRLPREHSLASVFAAGESPQWPSTVLQRNVRYPTYQFLSEEPLELVIEKAREIMGTNQAFTLAIAALPDRPGFAARVVGNVSQAELVELFKGVGLEVTAVI
jgi:hypothetical protein